MCSTRRRTCQGSRGSPAPTTSGLLFSPLSCQRARTQKREKKLARCYPPFFALTCQIPTGNDVAPEQDPRKGNGKWSLGSLNQRCQGVQKKMEEFCFTFWLNSAHGKTKTERDGLHQRSRELLMLFSISSKSSGSVIYYYSSLLSRRRWWRQCAGHMGPAALSFARQGGPFSSSFSVENTKDLLERRRRGGGDHASSASVKQISTGSTFLRFLL